MARQTFNAELGYGIYDENGELLIEILSGTGAPGGDAGKQDAAPIGSLWLRTDGNGGQYKKTANAGAASDWKEVGDVSIDTLNWRNEKVVALTNDSISAGSNIDGTAWTDNDDGFTPVVGQYVIGDGDGAPALFEITAVVSASDFDLAAASQPIADNDTFMVQNYLPDPAGQENQAIFHVPTAGSPGVKIADVDFAFATSISLAAPYTPASGDPTAGDSVQAAIEKLDGNNDNQDTLLGTSQGDTNLGTFPGSTISDNNSVKGALTELETAVEAIEVGDPAASIPAATPTTILPISVDNFNYIEYEVVVTDNASPNRREGFKYTLMHDGVNGGADAADADDTLHTKLRKKGGGNKVQGLTVDFVLTGTGAAQTIAMRIQTTNACTASVRRTAVATT